jgi:type I restriction enzyme S subunit
MSKENKLIPELRFPEFEKDGEWRPEKLSIIAEVIMGSSPSSSFYNENRIGLPLLQGNADIKNRLSAPRIYTTEVTKECEIDDILLSVRAPVGTVAKSLHNACIGRGISALRALKPNSQEYLYQWLFSYEASWQKVSQGGTFDAVNSDDIRNLLVPAPNPKEQQKIASCLSSLDEIIATHSQKLNLLKDHKKGMMQNLFPQEGEKVPKYRFKEFENDGVWGEKSLEYLTIKIGDGIHTTPKYDPSGKYYFINGNNLIEGKIVVDEKTKRVSSEEFEIHKKHLTKKTIFLSINGTIGNLAFYNNEMVVLGKSACYITPSQKLNNVFLYYSLQSPSINDYFISELTGSTIKNLSLKSIRETAIHLPSEIEQQKISFCLSSLDALITAQTEKIEQLKLHKTGLMQGLFPKIEI